ncbi:MAG: ATP-binding protein [Acidobacteriota bacterium]
MTLFKKKGFDSNRRWREDRQAIREFDRSLTLIVDPDALMASIAARIKEHFMPDCVIILRAAPGSVMFNVSFSTDFALDELKNIRLTQRDHLAKWLLTNEKAMVVGQDPGVFNYLSPSERETLTLLNVRICVPLIALNRLTGLIFLCSTQEQWGLSEEDMSLLQMLMNQASIAFETAYLYQEQRDRLLKLYRTERLAAAGQLAASVAHEIRNPLTSIRSTVQYLLKDCEENSPKRSLIEGVIAEVDRIDRTVDGLLSLTRRTEFKPERVALDQLIEQTLRLVGTEASNQSVEILWSSPGADCYILGDTSQLRQLFLNLILNALQAMPKGGQLEVKLTCNPESLEVWDRKNWVQVSLTDTGCGIPTDNLDKIFDPFFTTKQGGTGLGLSISYAVARQHGGQLEIRSSEGGGTTVAARFPLLP